MCGEGPKFAILRFRISVAKWLRVVKMLHSALGTGGGVYRDSPAPEVCLALKIVCRRQSKAGHSAGSTASAGVSNVLVARVEYVPAPCTHRPLWEALPGVVHSALGTGGESLRTLPPQRFA